MNDNRHGTVERVLEKEFTKTFAQTESWGHTAGASITVGTTFKTGVPSISEGEISMEVSASYEHTWGTEQYEEETYSTNVKCSAPPGTKTVCDYITNAAELDVPYTMHLTQEGGGTKTINGVWTGVQTFDDHITFEEYR